VNNLCVKCPTPGICCLREDTAMGKRIAVDECCPFLDHKTHKCSIYKQRHKNPDCLTIEKMIELGTCPKWCPYVKTNAEYQNRADTRIYKYKIIEEESP
jgi:uncharacterized cysteine cluster protein YcgN (CxxCxxCC family)